MPWCKLATFFTSPLRTCPSKAEMVACCGETAISMVPPWIKLIYAMRWINTIAFCAPKRFASKADIILASSSLLKERNTSTVSICSSNNKFWSDASPWNTSVFDSFSANISARSPLRSINFTAQWSSNRFATPAAIFPPPTIITRLYGFSNRCNSLITALMCSVAQIKVISSPASIMVEPCGRMALSLRKIDTMRQSICGICCLNADNAWPTKAPP